MGGLGVDESRCEWMRRGIRGLMQEGLTNRRDKKCEALLGWSLELRLRPLLSFIFLLSPLPHSFLSSFSCFPGTLFPSFLISTFTIYSVFWWNRSFMSSPSRSPTCSTPPPWWVASLSCFFFFFRLLYEESLLPLELGVSSSIWPLSGSSPSLNLGQVSPDFSVPLF